MIKNSRPVSSSCNTGVNSGVHTYISGVEIALIRLSGLSKKLSGQVDRPAEVIRRTSR